MRDWLVFVDVSGSLLADAMAEIAGECLRCLLQEKSIKSENIYLWGQDVRQWNSESLQSSVAWRGLFSGTGSLESLFAEIEARKLPALVISDGYVFKDASPREKHSGKKIKTERKLLLLTQDRRFVLRDFCNDKDIFSPAKLMVLSDQLKADGQKS